MFKEIAHDGFPARPKNVRIKFRGRYYKYPLEAMDLARSMDPLLAVRAFVDYLGEVIRRKILPRTLVSAEDWVTRAMGRTLYGLFFGPYTQKVWGIPPSQLAASFAQHRIPHISLWKVIQTSLRTGRAKISGSEHRYAPLVVELFYPPRGAGLISERMAERIRAKGGRVETGTLVTGLDVMDGRVIAVRYRRVPRTDDGGQLCMMTTGLEGNVDPYRMNGSPGPEERIECDGIVNTIPLPHLVKLLGDAVSPEAKAAADVLRFRALTIVGLRVKRPRVLPAQSIYFQDKMFNRLSETRNYGGSDVCGPDETVLLCDITCDIGDAIWTADPSELGHRCAEELEVEGFLKMDEVVERVALRTTFGYPVYVVGYEQAIDTLMKELLRFENVVTGGRQGLYKYVDMDIASEMGLSMADHVLSGRTKQETIAHIPYEDRVFA
ncbi:MAG: hypothetical protein HYY42_04890, partial [Chloroflexi bacterium]|nr:hypothetical protein [Chloroflexota bacterium]